MKKNGLCAEDMHNKNEKSKITKNGEIYISEEIVNTSLCEKFNQKIKIEECFKKITPNNEGNAEIIKNNDLNQENIIVIDCVSTIQDNNKTRSRYNIQQNNKVICIEDMIDSLSFTESATIGQVYDMLYLRDLVLGSSSASIKGIIGSLESISSYLERDLYSYTISLWKAFITYFIMRLCVIT